jgi:[acyl-carrier-protein] S-malonyltransferase
VVECGPGKVLTGMVARIDASMVGLPLFDPASLAGAEAALQETAA